MTTEQFWDKYMNEDILEIFDDTCDFFSKKLPQEFLDEYDVGEALLETFGHQESAKNFENVLKFIEILQTKQPELYKEYFPYFNQFLIEYYSFHQNTAGVNQAFSFFIDDPLQGIDNYLSVFKTLTYYQHSGLLEEAIEKNFATINESEDLIGFAASSLAMAKCGMVLQEAYEQKEDNFDENAFAYQLIDYDFNFNKDFFSNLKIGFFNPTLEPEQLKESFKKDKKNTLLILQWYFLRHMLEKGFTFYLSATIWSSMLEYLNKNNSSKKTTDLFFSVQPAKFEKYLVAMSGDMFTDNKPDMIATLWGSVYIYEFLYKIGIIPEKLFQEFMETSEHLKSETIEVFTHDLWKSSFVHHWQKPDCISADAFIEEDIIFKNSFTSKKEKKQNYKDSIPYNSSKIDQVFNLLTKKIHDKEEKQRLNLSEKLPFYTEEEEREENEEGNDEKKEETNRYYHSSEPIRVENKVGRNEPCSCGSGKKYKKCCGK